MKRILSLLSLFAVLLSISSCAVFRPDCIEETPPCALGSSPHTYDNGKNYNDNGAYTEYTCILCGSTYRTKDGGAGSEASKQLYELITVPADLDASDIIMVKTLIPGASPGSLTDIEYSTDNEDIVSLAGLLSCSATPSNELIKPGEATHEYTYYTKNGSFTLIISDSGKFYSGDTLYQLTGSLPRIKSPSLSTHSFVTATDKYELYDNGVLIGTFSGLSELEFTEYYGPVTLMIPTRYIKTDFGILRLYNSTVFSLELLGSETTTFYELTSGHSFPLE